METKVVNKKWDENVFLQEQAQSVHYLMSSMSPTFADYIHPRPGCKPFNPDRYRFPLGVMVLVVLVFFIILIVWRLVIS